MTEQKIIVGKFINNLDSEDLTSEKLQGVVNNVYAKAISSHKKKEKEVEDNTKDLEKETVEFIKSNHDRLKANKEKPDKELNEKKLGRRSRRKVNEDAYDDYFGDKGVDYLIGLVKDIAKKGDLRRYNLTQSDFYEVWDGLKELKKNRSFDTIVENVANFIGENSNLLVYSKGNGWHIEVNNMYESKELKEDAKPSELWYNKKEALNNIWGLVCEGDNRLEDIRYIFESGLLKPNEFRYDRWGAKHSLIMGALRNGNYKTAELLKSLGEKILKSEVEEYKDLMARKVYSDETTRDALDEDKIIAKFQDDDQVHEIHDYENGTFANHYDAERPGHEIAYYDSEKEARKQMRRHRPFAKEIKESKKLKEGITPDNIYDALVKELPAEDIDHHYSDLYVRKTPKSTEIINKLDNKSLLSTFVDNIDKEVWYELPFCYTPFWNSKSKQVNESEKVVAKFEEPDGSKHEIRKRVNDFANFYNVQDKGSAAFHGVASAYGYSSEEEARKFLKKHRPQAKEIKESKKLKEDLTDIKQEWEDFLASGKNNVIEFDDGDYVYFDIDFDRNVIYAGSATNAGILRQYEVYLDSDLNLDENIAELYDEIVWEKEQDEHHSFGKQKIGTLKNGKELFIDTAYGSGYQLCSVDGFGNYNPYSEMGVGNTIKIIDFDTPEDVIEFAKKQYGDRLVLESKKLTKKGKKLKEARSSKKLIYTIGDRFVAHQLDGVTSPFNREFDAAKKYRDISNDPNFKHGSIGCKGKSYKTGVNQWVKTVEPTEFMVWTKKENPSWKDDVLDVYYRKETVNESKKLTRGGKRLTEAEDGNMTIETSTSILDMFYPSLYQTIDDYYIPDNEWGRVDDILANTSMEFAEEAIRQVFPNATVKFKELRHPREYNYGGENIIFDVTLPRADYESIKQKVAEDPNFVEFLKKNSPRSGYIPFGAYTVDKFKTQDDMYSIGQIVKFLVDEEDMAYDFDEKFREEISSNFDTYDILWEEVMDWLREHDQAYQDFLTHFHADENSVIDLDSIIGWISEHDTLSQDFENRFGFSLGESLKEEIKDKKPYIVAYLGKEIASFDYPSEARDYYEKKTYQGHTVEGYWWGLRSEMPSDLGWKPLPEEFESLKEDADYWNGKQPTTQKELEDKIKSLQKNHSFQFNGFEIYNNGDKFEYFHNSMEKKYSKSPKAVAKQVFNFKYRDDLTEDLSKIQEEQTMKLVRLLGKGLITKQEFEEKLYGILEPKLVRAPMFKNTKIKDFYTDNYPEDDLGEEINDTVTVQDVVDLLNDGRGAAFYSLIGVSDSLVRERIFAFIADACGVKYEKVYDKWLGESLTENKKLTESLDNVDIQKFVDSYKKNYELLSGITNNEDAIEFFDRWVAKKKHDNFMKKFAEVNGDYVSSDREAVAFAFTLEDFGLIFESFKTPKKSKLTERLEPKDLDQIFTVGKEFTLTKPLELEHYVGDDYFDLGPEDYDDEDNLIIRPEKLEEFKNKFIAKLKEDEFYDQGVIDNYVVVDKELGDVKLELPAGTKLTVKKNEPNETMFNKNPWFSKVTFTTPNGDFETFYNNPGLLERITKTSK